MPLFFKGLCWGYVGAWFLPNIAPFNGLLLNRLSPKGAQGRGLFHWHNGSAEVAGPSAPFALLFLRYKLKVRKVVSQGNQLSYSEKPAFVLPETKV